MKKLSVLLAFVLITLALALPASAEINESVNVNMTFIQNPVNMNVTGTFVGGTDGLVFGFILFMLVLAGVFFIAPTLFGSFSATPWVNLTFVRGSYVIGFFMLFFANASIGDIATTLIPQVADTAWFVFEIVGVILEVVLTGFMAITLYDVVMSIRMDKAKKRMGGGDDS